jgi:hypothetical protein
MTYHDDFNRDPVKADDEVFDAPLADTLEHIDDLIDRRLGDGELDRRLEQIKKQADRPRPATEAAPATVLPGCRQPHDPATAAPWDATRLFPPVPLSQLLATHTSAGPEVTIGVGFDIGERYRTRALQRAAAVLQEAQRDADQHRADIARLRAEAQQDRDEFERLRTEAQQHHADLARLRAELHAEATRMRDETKELRRQAALLRDEAQQIRDTALAQANDIRAEARRAAANRVDEDSARRTTRRGLVFYRSAEPFGGAWRDVTHQATAGEVTPQATAGEVTVQLPDGTRIDASYPDLTGLTPTALFERLDDVTGGQRHQPRAYTTPQERKEEGLDDPLEVFVTYLRQAAAAMRSPADPWFWCGHRQYRVVVVQLGGRDLRIVDARRPADPQTEQACSMLLPAIFRDRAYPTRLVRFAIRTPLALPPALLRKVASTRQDDPTTSFAMGRLTPDE